MFCVKNNMDHLMMHSGQRGAATKALACGIGRSRIKLVGNWASSAVDKYFHPERPGMVGRFFGVFEVM